jgi:hypothetical protein
MKPFVFDPSTFLTETLFGGVANVRDMSSPETELLKHEYERLLQSHKILSPEGHLLDEKRKEKIEQNILWRLFRRISDDKVPSTEGDSWEAAKKELLSGMNPHLSRLANKVERTMTEMNLSLDAPVYIGEFPTGSFEGSALPQKSGYLILINTGLMSCLYQLCKLLANHTTLTCTVTEHRGKRSERVYTSLSPNEITNGFSEILLVYYLWPYYKGDPSLREIPDPPSALWAEVFRGIAYSAEMFVIAHEYGHCLMEHTLKYQSTRDKLEDDSVEAILNHPWGKEIQADAIACGIMFGMLPKDVSTPAQMYLLQAIFAGIVLFFCVDNLYTKLLGKLKGEANLDNSHPPPGLRLNFMREMLKKMVNDEVAFHFADLCEEEINKLEPEIINTAMRRQDKIMKAVE